jgi:hypothetical protein
MTRYDYITVGHVTRDAIEDRPDGTVSQPGGGAFYSALQAARLGLRTLILTQGVPEEIEMLLEPYREELEVHVIPAAHTTALSTRGCGTERVQRVLAWAGEMVDRGTVELDTSILHLAPVAHEIPTAWSAAADFVGITPQGLIRHWQERQEVPLVQLDAPSLLGDIPLSSLDAGLLAGEISLTPLDPAMLPPRFQAAVIGEQECDSCHALFAAARHCGACVAVTAGSRPTTVHQPNTDSSSVVQAAVPRALVVRDDLGAGDVFAAAFFISLRNGSSVPRAAAFGNAAAVARIAGVGPDAIAGRTQIEAVAPATS